MCSESIKVEINTEIVGLYYNYKIYIYQITNTKNIKCFGITKTATQTTCGSFLKALPKSKLLKLISDYLTSIHEYIFSTDTITISDDKLYQPIYEFKLYKKSSVDDTICITLKTPSNNLFILDTNEARSYCRIKRDSSSKQSIHFKYVDKQILNEWGTFISTKMPLDAALEILSDFYNDEDTSLSSIKTKALIASSTEEIHRPLYVFKSPTKNNYIVILSISDDHKKCISGLSTTDPTYSSSKTQHAFSIRTTNIHYSSTLRRYFVCRQDNCIDVTHLIKNKK